MVESTNYNSERTDDYPWYGLRTKPNHERIAATVLGSKRFDAYLPECKVERRWSDRTVRSLRPLFPGYVFCRFDEQWPLPVLTTPGVLSILGCGTKPVPIDEQEIEAVRILSKSGLAAQHSPFLREGQRVRMASGPLKGVEGILLKKKDDLRVVLSVTILQRSVSVTIERDWIAPTSK